jgi:tetratricopeptide (TPR) repeat protein
MTALQSRIIAIVTLLIGLAAISFGRQLLSESSAKYSLVKSVFDKIVWAVGDGRQAPRLEVWSGANPQGLRVAWYSRDAAKEAIGIEESAVNLCLKFGPDSLDALAVLLGHELAHFYRVDTIAAEYPTAFAAAPVYNAIKTIASRDSRVAIETDADLFGGFYGCVAGYNTLGVNARVLDGVYKTFSFPDFLPGYLNLGERQAVARSTKDSLSKLIPIVDAGACLFALGNYAESASCFDLLVRKFPSRDMFNNAGVARALEAIKISQPHAMPLPYPFEFDVDMGPRSQGSRHTRGVPTGAERQRALYRLNLLLAAKENFKQAQRRDPGYVPALVNLSCVYDLLGDSDSAIVLATDAIASARKTNDRVSLSDAYQARCIVYAGRKDTSKANADLRLVKRYQARSGGSEKQFNDPETINGSRANSFTLDRTHVAALVPGGTGGDSTIRIYSEDLTNSRAILVEWSGKKMLAIQTLPQYDLESNGRIKVGSRRKEVEDKYGSPKSVLTTSKGECLVYETGKICFWIGANDQVQGWMIYDRKE